MKSREAAPDSHSIMSGPWHAQHESQEMVLDNISHGNVVMLVDCSDEASIFNASRGAGKTGLVIGLSRNRENLGLAMKTARRGPEGVPCSNVEFIIADDNPLPIGDCTIDVIVVGPPATSAGFSVTFSELERILKPGGKVLQIS